MAACVAVGMVLSALQPRQALLRVHQAIVQLQIRRPLLPLRRPQLGHCLMAQMRIARYAGVARLVKASDGCPCLGLGLC